MITLIMTFYYITYKFIIKARNPVDFNLVNLILVASLEILTVTIYDAIF